MTCLACGAPQTADVALGSPHALAPLLCVAHLVEALSVKPEAPALDLRYRERCSGLRRTCPRPPVHLYPYGRFCDHCAPTGATFPAGNPYTARLHVPQAPPMMSPALPDDGMIEAILAASSIGRPLRTTKHAYGEPLEGTP